MIKEIKMYTIICDGCGKNVCEGSEYAGWDDVDYVWDTADEENWIKDEDNPGTHYCPDCYEYDDDDNLVIIKKLTNG